jgi:hypothetical protein
MNPEQKRLDDERLENIPWKKWGPYLSEQARAATPIGQD